MNIKNKIKNKKVITTVQTTGLYDITLIMWRDNTLSHNELSHTNTIQKEKIREDQDEEQQEKSHCYRRGDFDYRGSWNCVHICG